MRSWCVPQFCLTVSRCIWNQGAQNHYSQKVCIAANGDTCKICEDFLLFMCSYTNISNIFLMWRSLGLFRSSNSSIYGIVL